MTYFVNTVYCALSEYMLCDSTRFRYFVVIFEFVSNFLQAISDFSIVEVVKPNVGERKPARVRADVTLQLSVHQSVKEEWEGEFGEGEFGEGDGVLLGRVIGPAT